MKERVNKLEDKISTHDAEITLLRTFKHDTNVHIHAHSGKFELLESQHNNVEAAVKELTVIVKDAVKTIGSIMTLKSMFIGAGIVFVPTVTGMFFLFQWYMKFRGIE